MNNPFLVGKSIYLRALELTDLDGNYIQWLNDPEISRFNSHNTFPYNRESAKSFIERTFVSKDQLVLAICLKDGDHHIGNISLQSISQIHRSAEFAIMMGEKSAMGKGYSKQAASLILQHGFQSLNLHRIYCGTHQDNLPMRKLAAFLGMKEEGVRRQALFKNGDFFDSVVFGVLKEEFDNRSL